MNEVHGQYVYRFGFFWLLVGNDFPKTNRAKKLRR